MNSPYFNDFKYITRENTLKKPASGRIKLHQKPYKLTYVGLCGADAGDAKHFISIENI